MSIDMSQFYQVFFEEAAEHLTNMESLLLELDLEDPDTEQLNAIFRAAHSIKGSSGTFGFTDLQDVTHILENLLDRIRKGELAISSEMIDAFLDTGDVLQTLLGAHRGGSPADPADVEAICARLKQLTVDPTAPATPAAPAVTTAAPAPASAPAPMATSFEVSFVLDDMSAEDAATTVENLVGELAQRWPIRIVARAADQNQPWRIALGDDADEEMVRGMLEFVARSDSIRVHRVGDEEAVVASDPAGAYGFFADDEQTTTVAAVASVADVDDSFGFFEPLPADADTDADTAVSPAPTFSGAAPATETAYGFFTDLPASGPVEAPATTNVVLVTEEKAYGFFTDIPAPSAEAPAAKLSAVKPVLAATAGSDGDGFGFFVDIPLPGTAVAPTAVATVAAVAAVASTEEKKPRERKPAAPAAAAGDTSIRVGIDKVDQLINLVGELVITQAMLAQSAQGVDPVAFERLHTGLAQLERNTRDLQETVMSIRMMPMSVVFSRFPRVVRDLSQKLGKQVELKTSGESTELDKGLTERITDPLTHLIRNSLDHGIEMPEDRAAKGKQPVGTITLKAYHQSGNIVIEVGDDGAGLNRTKILSKAKERGLPVHDQMTDAEVWMLIFEAGFSTADQVTEVSGRGVGMDVVKRNITGMGGRVEIDSMTGVGTRMTVRLPLTLAILDGMSVCAGRDTYIIPLGYVIESLQAEKGMIKSVSGVERLIQVRGEYLPVIALHEIFRIPRAITRLEDGIMVIVEADGIKAALFIDALVGQHQVVIKSLEANYRKVPGIAGATIMGDGHVALILDVAALVQMVRHAQQGVPTLPRAA
jgi:two-component system chemotaxis sensor kinase CheA